MQGQSDALGGLSPQLLALKVGEGIVSQGRWADAGHQERQGVDSL